MIISYVKGHTLGLEDSYELQELYKYVKSSVVQALKDHRKIMNLTWRVLKDHCGLPGGDLVHKFGWDFNEETRRMREVFEAAATFTGFEDKKLEDYL
jgi:hypothetical protein